MNSEHSKVVFGLILVVLGGLFLLDTLGQVDFWQVARRFWPLILIILGLALLLRKDRQRTEPVAALRGKVGESGVTGVFGDIRISGVEKGVGVIERSLVFGDIVIDLAGSKLIEGENYIDVSVLFGDISIVVPLDFPLKVDLGCCAGSASFDQKVSDGLFPKIRDRDENFTNSQARLSIKGRACFGDLKVTRIRG